MWHRRRFPLALERRRFALTDTTTTGPMTARLTAITGRIGSLAESLLGLAPGSTVARASTDMWTTATIRATVTADRFRTAGRDPSPTSREMKHATAKATWARLAIA